jgi:hypothetical protein
MKIRRKECDVYSRQARHNRFNMNRVGEIMTNEVEFKLI